MVHDVLIVGAGPSGLCIASELALAGVKVKVLERRADVVQSRAGTILPRVLELLDSRDLAETFIERARGIRPNPLFATHIWAGMQPVHWEHLKSRFGFRMILPQNFTEEMLYAHALSLGVEIEREATVTSVDQDEEVVTVGATTLTGERSFRTR
jgi:2-polyprenyl-6-methoxyphenol hydroxylase-like FAD-dependent oxidoreductase